MAIKLDLTLLHRHVPEELRGTVHEVRAQVIDVVQGVRQMSHVLHPPALDDFGVVAAIESVAEKYHAMSELEIRLTAPDTTIRCAPPLELMLFRVFQEALLNVVKHADVDDASAQLRVDDDWVVAVVRDEGPGFDPEDVRPDGGRHVGLGLLRDRARLVGGSLDIDSWPADGTRLTLRLPRGAGAAAGLLPLQRSSVA